VRSGKRSAPRTGIPPSESSGASAATTTHNDGQTRGIDLALAYPMRSVSWAVDDSGIHGYASGIFYAILATNSASTVLEGSLPNAILLRRHSLSGQTVLWSERGNLRESIVLLDDARQAIAYVTQNAQWTTIVIGSVDEANAHAALRDACNALSPGEQPISHQTQMAFWYLGRFGACKTIRDIEEVCWDDLARNYPTTTKGQLDQLINTFRPTTSSARLLLFHGPPGTGKTYATRALARSWRDWCQCEYVVDPEVLFSKSDYLLSVLLDRGSERAAEDEEAPERWRLIILEDTGELLHVDAKRDVGQALARLLNTTDGILGFGTRTMVLITTNEEVGKINPAIVRPGRCAAAVEFCRFTQKEGNQWLAAAGTAERISAGLALCDLYGIVRGRQTLAFAYKIGFTRD
jgi:hypothetical protein